MTANPRRPLDAILVIGMGLFVLGAWLSSRALSITQVCNTIVWGMCTYVFNLDALYMFIGLTFLASGLVLLILAIVKRAHLQVVPGSRAPRESQGTLRRERLT